MRKQFSTRMYSYNNYQLKKKRKQNKNKKQKQKTKHNKYSNNIICMRTITVS